MAIKAFRPINLFTLSHFMTAVYTSPLLTVQYSPVVLFLRPSSILANPFHPLLRLGLQRHEENWKTGYLLHLHTSAKKFTGKESSVRHAIRNRVRDAWRLILKEHGVDVVTGKWHGLDRFGNPLTEDPTIPPTTTTSTEPRDPKSKQKLKLNPKSDAVALRISQKLANSSQPFLSKSLVGTVSITPSESCLTVPFQNLESELRLAFAAVQACEHRHHRLEKVMQPKTLWNYFDSRRRVRLRRYKNAEFDLNEDGYTLKDTDPLIMTGENGQEVDGDLELELDSKATDGDDMDEDPYEDPAQYERVRQRELNENIKLSQPYKGNHPKDLPGGTVIGKGRPRTPKSKMREHKPILLKERLSSKRRADGF